MRMNKGAILASMVVIALASVLAGAGTMAYFSDTAANPTSFDAGIIDIEIWDEGEGKYVENAASQTFEDMLPGDEVTVRYWIHVKDTSEPIKCLLMKFEVTGDGEGDNPPSETNTGGKGELDNYLYVTKVDVYKDDLDNWLCGYKVWGEGPDIAGPNGIGDPIRVWCQRTPGSPSPQDTITFTDCYGNSRVIDYDACDDIVYYCVKDGQIDPCQEICLEVVYRFHDTGAPQNDAQGDTLTVKVSFEARSNPCCEVPG